MKLKKVKFAREEADKAAEVERSYRYDTMKKGIYILPNLFTSASLVCGFYAIVQVVHENFYNAAIAVIAAALFDGIDGKIARLTGTASRFGIEYDSLADLVSFGVAPGIMIYMWALKPYGRVGWLAAFLYVICGALRLARFNIQVNSVEKSHFNGLPIPAAATMISTTILMHYEYFGEGTIKKIIIPIMTYILAYLMVSNVKYLSFKDLELVKRKPFHTLVLAVMILTVIVAKPELMLFALISIYIVSGPLGIVKRLVKGQKMQTG